MAKTDPWSSEKKAPNSVNLRDLGSVRGCTNSGQPHWSRALLVPAELEQPGVKRAHKPQASSLTAGPGYDRMNLERNNYGQ